MKSKGPSLTLFAATIDFLRMVVNIGFLLCLRAFLINLYRSDIFIAKKCQVGSLVSAFASSWGLYQ